MAFFWQAASLPKAGYAPEQNEDAYRVERSSTEGGDELLLALADGATEAVYSGAWARALVAAAQPDWLMADEADLNERLEPARRAFAPMTPGQEAPWYVRNKFLSQGSQATLLVAGLSRGQQAGALILRAVAIGDACLLLFQAGGQVRAFPVQASRDFGVNPVLVRNRQQPSLTVTRWQAELGAGDFLIACSDAMAKWALECLERQHADIFFEALLALLAADAPPDAAQAAEPDRSEPTPTEPGSAGEAPSLLERLQDWVGLFRPAQPLDPPPEKSSPAEPAALPDPVERPSFAGVVEQYRAHGSQPALRDDDTTLVLCVPVNSAEANRHRQAVEIVQRHRQAAESRPPVIAPASH